MMTKLVKIQSQLLKTEVVVLEEIKEKNKDTPMKSETDMVRSRRSYLDNESNASLLFNQEERNVLKNKTSRKLNFTGQYQISITS